MLIRELLKASGLPTLDAEVILSHILKRTRSWLLAHDNDAVTEADMKRFEAFAQRRGRGEPVAYITGQKEFFGRMFFVTTDVLIPRPATEELVTCALDFLDNPRFIEKEIDSGISALCVPLASGKPEILIDVGTGSGCIAATLALEGRKEKILAVDVSEAALDIARENFAELSAQVITACGDGPSFVSAMHQPFVIVSNPPYIADGTVLTRDVAHYEPPMALFAGNAGMDVLTALARAATENPCCLGVCLELETGQTAVIKRLLGVM